jgi:hypothetical protein
MSRKKLLKRRPDMSEAEMYRDVLREIEGGDSVITQLHESRNQGRLELEVDSDPRPGNSHANRLT